MLPLRDGAPVAPKPRGWSIRYRYGRARERESLVHMLRGPTLLPATHLSEGRLKERKTQHAQPVRKYVTHILGTMVQSDRPRSKPLAVRDSSNEEQ